MMMREDRGERDQRGGEMTRFTVAGRERLRCCAQQEREREQRIFLCLLENLYHYYSAFLSSGRSCRRNAHTRRATRRGSAAALLTDVQTNTPAPSSRPLSVTPPRTVCHIGSLSPCPIPLFFLYVLSPQFIFFIFTCYRCIPAYLLNRWCAASRQG